MSAPKKFSKRIEAARETYRKPPCERCLGETWPDWTRCTKCGHWFCTACHPLHGCGTDFKSHEQREAEAAEKKARDAGGTVDFAAMVNALRDSVRRENPVTAAQERTHRLKTTIFPMLRACGWEERFYRELAGDWGCAMQVDRFAECRKLFTGAGAIVALVGPRGVGKTTIGFQLALERLDAAWVRYLDVAQTGQRAALSLPMTPYVKLTDLLARFKALYADFGTVDPERLIAARERFSRDDALVVIDEIHECDELRATPRLLTDLIDRRYAAKRDTLLITNQTAKQFAESIGDSIYSRLSEHGAILRCEWESWRDRA